MKTFLFKSDSPERAHRVPVPLVLDLSERLFLLILYGWLTYRLVVASMSSGEYASLILLPSEGLIVLFALIRRSSRDMSRQASDWGLAVLATCAPLSVGPVSGATLAPPAMGVALILFGALFQMHAKVVLGRSFGMVAANRGIKLNGPYRFVRHPMYAGYLLTHLGFLLLNPSAWNVAAYAVCYSLQIPRLIAEERLLKRDPRYDEYMQTVRYRLVPGVF